MEKKAELCYPTKELIEEYFGDDFSDAIDFFGDKLYANEKDCGGGMYCRHEIKAEKQNHAVYKKMLEQKYNFMGIDVPLLITQGAPKTIMLIAQDPKRNKKYTKSNGSPNTVFVGTPFAVDRVEVKKRYRDFFCGILGLGVDIYITDVFKFYASDNNFRDFRKMQKQGELKEFCPIELLKKEIDAVKPAKTFALGRKTFDAVENCGFDVEYIRHPSPLSFTPIKSIVNSIEAAL